MYWHHYRTTGTNWIKGHIWYIWDSVANHWENSFLYWVTNYFQHMASLTGLQWHIDMASVWIINASYWSASLILSVRHPSAKKTWLWWKIHAYFKWYQTRSETISKRTISAIVYACTRYLNFWLHTIKVSLLIMCMASWIMLHYMYIYLFTWKSQRKANWSLREIYQRAA